MVQETNRIFDDMSSTVPQNFRHIWNEEITRAEKRRLQHPSAMDILGAKEMETDIESDRVWSVGAGAGSGTSGSADREWLTLALAIEERQYVLHFIFIINDLIGC